MRSHAILHQHLEWPSSSVTPYAISGYSARVERVVLLHVVAFDWNCPQHITPRFSEEEIAEFNMTGDPA